MTDLKLTPIGRIAWAEMGRRLHEYDRLREINADLLAALELLLPVAQRFEKQASKGTGSRRGGPVFTKARAAIAKARGE